MFQVQLEHLRNAPCSVAVSNHPEEFLFEQAGQNPLHLHVLGAVLGAGANIITFNTGLLK